MVNYKEIFRLASEGTSQRQIAVSVGHSRDIVVLATVSFLCAKYFSKKFVEPVTYIPIYVI